MSNSNAPSSRPVSGAGSKDSNDLVGAYIRDFSKSKGVTAARSNMSDKQRRLTGVILGAAIGLAYGVVSQMINRVILPGIPFYQPPLGPWGNILVTVLVVAFLGLATTWPASSIHGIGIGVVLGAVTIDACAWVLGRGVIPFMAPGRVEVALLCAFLPITALLLPVMGVFRWVVDKQQDVLQEPVWALRRIWLPLGLVILAGFAGSIWVYPKQAQFEMSKINAVIQSGLKATDVSSLPLPLQADQVEGFIENAQGAYTVEWSNRVSALPAESTLIGERGMQDYTIVTVRFENGWTLVCLLATFGIDTRCEGSYLTLR